MLASWINAGNLRNKVYELKEENELLTVALQDLQRMDIGRKSGKYATDVLERRVKRNGERHV